MFISIGWSARGSLLCSVSARFYLLGRQGTAKYNISASCVRLEDAQSGRSSERFAGVHLVGEQRQILGGDTLTMQVLLDAY